MSYQPSLNDLPEEEYSPSLNDLPNEGGASENLLQQIQQSQSILPQGLPKDSLLSESSLPLRQGIPVNGLFSPQENVGLPNPRQMIGDVATGAAFYNPEIPAFSRTAELFPDILSRAGSFATNLGGKTLYGTIGSTAQQLGSNDQPLNAETITNALKNNLGLNALMQIPEAGLRVAGGLAETFNPEKFAAQEKYNIRNAYQDAVQRQQEAYAPVKQKYGTTPLSNDLEKDLNINPNDEQYFTPDVTRAYNTAKSDPNFNNLHKLQSIMYRNANNASTQETAQALNYARKLVNNKIENFLSSDQPMLQKYLEGRRITRDEVSPFESNNILQDIVNGKGKNVSPDEFTSALQNSVNKNTPNNPELYPNAPINSHPLSQALKNMAMKTDQAQVATIGLPSLAAALAAEKFYPGISSGVAGGLAGAGLGGMVKAGLTKGLTNATGVAQTPWLVKALSDVSPLYYGAGRGIIGQQ